VAAAAATPAPISTQAQPGRPPDSEELFSFDAAAAAAAGFEVVVVLVVVVVVGVVVA